MNSNVRVSMLGLFMISILTASLIFLDGGIIGYVTYEPPHIINANDDLLQDYSQSDWKFFFNGSVTTTIVNNESYAFNISDFRDSVLTRACYESEYVSLEPYKPYTLTGYMRTSNVPTYIQINTYFYNTTSSIPELSGKASLYAANQSDEWEEFSLVFTYPANGTTESGDDIKCMRIEISKPIYPGSGQVPQSVGTHVYVADLKLKEGIGFEQEPTQKIEVTTNNTRIDSLGNIEFWNGTDFEKVFPLAIYSTTTQNDYQTYSNNGFHAVVKRISSTSLADLAAATSDYNPNGLYLYGSLSPWTDSRLDMYNNVNELANRLELIKDSAYQDRFAMIDWDDESYNQSEVLENVTNTIETNFSLDGVKIAPTMVLLGNPGMSRYIHNFADTVSTYVTSHGTSVNSYNVGDIIYLDNLNKQTMPYGHALVTVSCDEFSGEYIRAVSYAAIAKGAKGLTFFRDGQPSDYDSCSEDNASLQRFWSEVPRLRNETEQLIDILRTPHWTEWEIQANDSFVVVGTRHYNETGYLFLANLHDNPVNVNFNISGLNYTPNAVKDFFNDTEIVNITNNEFNLSFDTYGVYVAILSNTTESSQEILNVSLTLSSNSSWIIDNGTKTNVSCLGNESGALLNLYRDDSLVDSDSGYAEDIQTLDVNNYSYVCNVTQNETYYFASESNTLYVQGESSTHIIFLDYSSFDNYTNFSLYNNIQLLNLQNVMFNNTYASLTYVENISINRSMNLTNSIILSNYSVFVNSSNISEFNVSANISFHTINETYPVLYYDNSICDSNTCTNIYYNTTSLEYSFTVAHFSNYSIREASCGDTLCNGGETCSTCSGDCGECEDDSSSSSSSRSSSSWSSSDEPDNTENTSSNNITTITTINSTQNDTNLTKDINGTNETQINIPPEIQEPSTIQNDKPASIYYLIAGIAILCLLSVSGYFMHKNGVFTNLMLKINNKNAVDKSQIQNKDIIVPKEISDYLFKMRALKVNDSITRKRLEKVGWSKEILDALFKQ